MPIDYSRLGDKSYRLDNFYRIVTKEGVSIPFDMNFAQKEVLDTIHTRTLILKCRQIGMSTFCVLSILDECIFNENIAAGIVSYSLDHAQHIFNKIIGHALDNFPKELKPYLGIIRQSAREIQFNNGSSLRVDTTLRGAAYQRVLVSEFGKICARNPLKAEEIITGTLQAISPNCIAIIESTGEGNEGFFAEMCNRAYLRGNDNLNPLSYKLFFYPWWKFSEYKLPYERSIDDDEHEYFKKIETECNMKLTKHQKYWYLAKKEEIGDKVKQEYPSTVSESFLASSDAYYFAQGIAKAEQEKRILESNIYDPLFNVYAAIDLGVNDLTAIVFFQLVHGEIRIIDYYEDSNKGIDFYAQFLLQDNRYRYHTIFLPHDASKRDPLDVTLGVEKEFRRHFCPNSNVVVLPKKDLMMGINNAKNTLNRCVFNSNKTKLLISHLSKYRKQWSQSSGMYLEAPLHDIHSNGADAFRYMSQAINHLETVVTSSSAMEKHIKAKAHLNSSMHLR